MTSSELPVCISTQLDSSGRGGREQVRTAFVIRFRSQVHAYLNACAHMALELDWNLGAYFD